jgi:hypothetical protein
MPDDQGPGRVHSTERAQQQDDDRSYHSSLNAS